MILIFLLNLTKSSYIKTNVFFLLSDPHDLLEPFEAFDAKTSMNNVGIRMGVRDHQCDICFKSYTYKKNLKRHEKFEHSVPSEQCVYCPYITRYKHSLKIHMNSQHDQSNFIVS